MRTDFSTLGLAWACLGAWLRSPPLLFLSLAVFFSVDVFALLDGLRHRRSWSVEERDESCIIRDATGQALAYMYHEDEPVRQRSNSGHLHGRTCGARYPLTWTTTS